MIDGKDWCGLSPLLEIQGGIRNGHSSSGAQLYRLSCAWRPSCSTTANEVKPESIKLLLIWRWMAPYQVALNVDQALKLLFTVKPMNSGHMSAERQSTLAVLCLWPHPKARNRHVFGQRNVLTLKRLLSLLSHLALPSTWPMPGRYTELYCSHLSCYKQEIHPADRAT